MYVMAWHDPDKKYSREGSVRQIFLVRYDSSQLYPEDGDLDKFIIQERYFVAVVTVEVVQINVFPRLK